MRAGALLVLAGVAAGGLGFGLALAGGPPARAWLALLASLLCAGGAAQGGLLYAALLRLTGARAALPLRDLAASGFALVLMLPCGILAVLIGGGTLVWPGLGAPRPELGSWLTPPVQIARAALTWGGMAAASLVFAWPEMKEREGGRGRAAGLVVACLLGLSLAAFDLVLMPARNGRNALLGGYFFMSCFYSGLVATALAARSWPPATAPPARARREAASADLGLLLGVSALFLLYLLAAQLMTIWYGNLRVETGFFLRRLALPWRALSLAAIAAAYALPALVLLGSRRARRGTPLALIAAAALAGLWVERYLLIAPAVLPAPRLGAPEMLLAAGSLAVLGGVSRLHLARRGARAAAAGAPIEEGA